MLVYHCLNHKNNNKHKGTDVFIVAIVIITIPIPFVMWWLLNCWAKRNVNIVIKIVYRFLAYFAIVGRYIEDSAMRRRKRKKKTYKQYVAVLTHISCSRLFLVTWVFLINDLFVFFCGSQWLLFLLKIYKRKNKYKVLPINTYIHTGIYMYIHPLSYLLITATALSSHVSLSCSAVHITHLTLHIKVWSHADFKKVTGNRNKTLIEKGVMLLSL